MTTAGVDAASAESVFTRALASGVRAKRELALTALGRWLAAQRHVSESDLLKLWKGLFYALWHADKAAVQAEVAERIAGVADSAPPEVAHAYFRACLVTLRRDWFVIDRLRLDKYMGLVRRVLTHTFASLKAAGWPAARTAAVASALQTCVLLVPAREAALGFALHVTDVLLATLGGAAPPMEPLLALLRPFAAVLAQEGHPTLAARCRTTVFEALAAGEGELALEAAGLTAVGALLFDTAADAETKGKYRDALYDLARLYRRAAAAATAAPAAAPLEHRPLVVAAAPIVPAAPARSPAPAASPAGSDGGNRKKRRRSAGGVEVTPVPSGVPSGAFGTPVATPPPTRVSWGFPQPPPSAGASPVPFAAPPPTVMRPARPVAPTPPSGAATGGKKRVRWAMNAIAVHAPTGPPHTEAGKKSLATAAAKPTLRRDTPLAARHRAKEAAAGGARSEGRPGGGRAGARGTPQSAPRPRAVDFF